MMLLARNSWVIEIHSKQRRQGLKFRSTLILGVLLNLVMRIILAA